MVNEVRLLQASSVHDCAAHCLQQQGCTVFIQSNLGRLGLGTGRDGGKTENVEKPVVLPLLVEGSRERRAFQECQAESEKDRFLVENVVKKEQKGNT